MDYTYFEQLEKNLELQASGFLMQKETRNLESQIRTEVVQYELSERLRFNLGSEISFIAKELGNIVGVLEEVNTDHFVTKSFNINTIYSMAKVISFDTLALSTRKPNNLESKWNLASALRSLMITKIGIKLVLEGNQVFSGIVVSILKDHFDVKCGQVIKSISYVNIISVSSQI